MEQNQLLEGRIRDLAGKTYNNDYVTHTEFLAASDLALFYQILRKQGVNPEIRQVEGVPFTVYGGREDADRNVVAFLPSYMDAAAFLQNETENGDIVRCIHITPLNRRFTEELSHRDYLGALMNMGIERDKIGDILTSETEAYVFMMADMAELIAKELCRVRHTSVQCHVVMPGQCTLEPKFEEVSGSVASVRLDSILAMVYRVSRGKAQEVIRAENVFVDGRVVSDENYHLKPDQRVSVRGHGKFIFTGVGNTTKKGRIYANVRRYI